MKKAAMDPITGIIIKIYYRKNWYGFISNR